MAHDSTFQSAIPGSSLTHKWGSFPFTRPPKYTDPNEALEYVWKTLHKKDTLKQLWYLLEKGATVFQITRAFLYKMSVEGLIQQNLGVVIYPTVGKMIDAIGRAKGIKTTIYPKFRDKLRDSMTNDTLSNLIGKKGVQVPPSALRFSGANPEKITQAAEAKKAMEQRLAQPIAKPAGLLNKETK